MKTKLVAVLGILVIMVAMGACARVEANKDASVIVPMDEFTSSKQITRQVELEVGQRLDVILGSNPSTGYSWTETALLSDAAVISQTGHAYVEPGKTTQSLVGAAGHEHWTFIALQAGTSKITMSYARPWEAGAVAWTFELTVVVK